MFTFGYVRRFLPAPFYIVPNSFIKKACNSRIYITYDSKAYGNFELSSEEIDAGEIKNYYDYSIADRL